MLIGTLLNLHDCWNLQKGLIRVTYLAVDYDLAQGNNQLQHWKTCACSWHCIDLNKKKGSILVKGYPVKVFWNGAFGNVPLKVNDV